MTGDGVKTGHHKAAELYDARIIDKKISVKLYSKMYCEKKTKR